MSLKKVVIAGGARIPFSRSMGKYMGVSNEDLMTAAVKEVVNKFNLKGKEIGEVATGAVIKHASDWNLTREVVMGSGLSAKTPAYDVIQACGTSLETVILTANKIALGQIDSAIAGGTDTNSDLPVVFSRSFSHKMLESYKGKTSLDKLKPFLKLGLKDLKPVLPGVTEPRTGLSMGQSCELMAQEWQISRGDQDQLALESHQKAAAAYEEGFYNDIVYPFHGLEKDNNMRANTNLESLAKLRPAFERSEKGTLTAGNSTPLTDGAAAVFLCSEEYAQQNNIPIQAYFVDAQVAAVDYVGNETDPEGLLMAPAYAVPRLLQRNNLKLQDFDFYEIHEAFAAQVLCTLSAWESDEFCKNKLGLDSALGTIDRTKMNIKGGSLALGHPFAATGARIVSGLSKIIDQHNGGRGLISICTGGGMGVTAILER